MVRVGLVGESPYDTFAIARLLKRRFKDIHFKAVAERVEGNTLDNPKVHRALTENLRNAKFDFLIYMRDLDGFLTEADKVRKGNEWYQKVSSKFGIKSFFLLNVWELEALIFADIGTLNSFFKITHQFKGDPAMIKEPKEKLMSITKNGSKKFQVAHCPEIFSLLDIDRVEKNCAYFKKFLAEFDGAISW